VQHKAEDGFLAGDRPIGKKVADPLMIVCFQFDGRRERSKAGAKSEQVANKGEPRDSDTSAVCRLILAPSRDLLVVYSKMSKLQHR
jgi:hypothetical protein